MIKSGLAGAFGLLLLGCSAAEPPPATQGKPEAPIDIDVRVVEGVTCGLLVHAAPRCACEFELEAILPEGVLCTAGETRWSGATGANQTRELKLDFRTDGKRREILVRATMICDGIRQTRVHSTVLHEDGLPPATKGVRGTNSRGEAILEFPSR